MYDRETKTLTCLECVPEQQSASPEITDPVTPEPSDVSNSTRPESGSDTSEVFAGVAGASAQREYERRKNARETRIRTAHPIAGGLILALSDDPQSTKAWATGARGEELLGHRLDRLSGQGVHVLHDRRIPRTKANIDHIVVGPSGVFVIDAKKYHGRPSLRVEGGLIRPRTEKLMVGSRNCTRLTEGVHKQLGLVRSALASADLEQIPVSGMLCFVEADWPLIGGDFTIANLLVLWPRKAASRVVMPGNIDDATAQHVHHVLASSFPPA
ncbi:MAG TPA: nuclease-related domain-containing protein [Microbacteriaceae bacterium]